MQVRAHSQLFLVFDVHALKEVKDFILTMSLYRFFAKAGMPSRVPSLSDKKIENANDSVKSGRAALALCARAVHVRVRIHILVDLIV